MKFLSRKNKKTAWFTAWRCIHLPQTWQGYLIALLAIIFCGQVFIAVESMSHSLSDTLYGMFPYVVPCFLLYEWIACMSSRD